MFQVYEVVTGKRVCVTGSFYLANAKKEALALVGVESYLVVKPV